MKDRKIKIFNEYQEEEQELEQAQDLAEEEEQEITEKGIWRELWKY